MYICPALSRSRARALSLSLSLSLPLSSQSWGGLVPVFYPEAGLTVSLSLVLRQAFLSPFPKQPSYTESL